MLSDIQIKKKIEILTNKLNVGRFNEVIEETSILLKKNKHQVLFNILSLAYQSIGEFKKSEITMSEALKLNPNNPYFLNNMGTTQHKIGNFVKAEEHFVRGLKIVPNYINILNNLGNLKKDLDQINEALNYYKKSLAVNPNVVETLLNISVCYQSLGNFKEATKFLNILLKENPKFTTADRLISSMTKYEKGNFHLDSMIKKFIQFKLNDNQLANLFFAIGKAYEDLKEYSKAFQNYSEGNNLLKKILNFEIQDERKNFENIKKNFSSTFKKINLEKSKKIIFIVGMPRSGTSLVEQILSSHNNVYGGGELVFLQEIINNNFLKKFENETSNINEDTESLLLQSYNEYIAKITLIDNSNKIFTDKSPLNFRYIGFIKNIFPDSKIINCKRNSLDVCWSNYKNFFAGSLPFTNDLKDIANYYNMYEDLIKFWKDLFPDEIYEMNYNKLIDNSENEIKRLLNFCQLDWDPNCMKHEKNTKTIKTASASQARQPINKSGLNNSKPFEGYITELSKILQS